MAAARRLIDRGVGAVLATLGSAGAVLVDETGSWMATPPPIVPRSTVGAGDASLAGYIRAEVGGADPPQRLQMAVAYGSAAAALPGSALPAPPDIDLDAVRVITRRPDSPLAPTRRYRHDKLHRLDHQHRSGSARRRRRADKQIGDRPPRQPTRRRRTHHRHRRVCSPPRWRARSSRPPGCPAASRSRTAARRYVDTASIGFARLNPAVDFGAPDGPADLAFLIAAPEAGGAEHMKLLSSLARALVRKEFVESLRKASTPDEVVALVDGVLNPAPAADKPAPATAPTAPAPAAKTLIAITACPTGIAHTYMAADSLAAAAKKAGVTMHVETQGSSGSTPVDAATIAAADAVIFATDVGVKDKHRFAGKPVIASGVKRAINEPDKMVAEALAAANNPNAARVEGGGAGAPHSLGRPGRGRRRLGHPHPADPAHRRELHDPVRRRGRPADRARLPLRRLRHRENPDGESHARSLARQHHRAAPTR